MDGKKDFSRWRDGISSDDEDHEEDMEDILIGNVSESDNEAPEGETNAANRQGCSGHVMAPYAMLWSPTNIVNRGRFLFMGIHGPLVSLSHPLEILEYFIDSDLLDSCVRSTNYFYQQKIQAYKDCKRFSPHSRLRLWKDTNRSEVMQLFGLMLLQGIISKPTEDLYWSKKTVFATPFFSRVMPQYRYDLLDNNLHFQGLDYTVLAKKPSEEKKRSRIEPLVNHLNSRFQAAYSLGACVGVLETTQSWALKNSGRTLSAIRSGIKNFALFESDTGYTHKFLPHVGRGIPTDVSQSGCPSDLANSSCRIAWILSQHVLGDGRTLFTDHTFSDPLFYLHLVQQQTDAVGIIRADHRGLDRRSKTLHKGDIDKKFCGKLMHLRWKDKKEISFLSTYHQDNIVTTKEKGKQKQKPMVVLDYCKNIAMANEKDKFLPNFTERKKDSKWFASFLRHLLNMVCHNAYVIYTKSSGQNVSSLDFRCTMLEQLFEKYCPGSRTIHSIVAECGNLDPLRGSSEDHFPYYIGIRPGTKHHIHKNCWYHNAIMKSRKGTDLMCRTCNVALCVDCFPQYHRRKGPWTLKTVKEERRRLDREQQKQHQQQQNHHLHQHHHHHAHHQTSHEQHQQHQISSAQLPVSLQSLHAPVNTNLTGHSQGHPGQCIAGTSREENIEVQQGHTSSQQQQQHIIVIPDITTVAHNPPLQVVAPPISVNHHPTPHI